MESYKQKLKDRYAEAIEAYQEGKPDVFLMQLRVSIEWFAKLLICDMASVSMGNDLLSGKTNVIFGTKIYEQGDTLESSKLITAIPTILEAFNKYSSITPKTKRKSAKKDFVFQCESLKGAYSICSGIAVHAGIHNMNLKLQARRYSILIPSIVDVLDNYNILTSPTITWLKTHMIIPTEPTDGELERMITDLEKRLSEENEKHIKALNELEQLNNKKDSIINQVNAAKIAAEEGRVEAQKAAFEANKKTEELTNIIENSKVEIDCLKKQIEELTISKSPILEVNDDDKDLVIEDEDFDDDQQDLIEESLNQSMLVAGCAGSGKSLLALKKAEQVINAGFSVYLIAYTKSLKSFMDEGSNNDKLSPYCLYHHQWKEALKMPSADYIIVDEIQDFTKEEILEFMHAAKKHFFFFGDTAQSIYNLPNRKTVPLLQKETGGDSIEQITNLRAMFLNANYRLPKAVARITQTYIGVGVNEYKDKIYQSKEGNMPHIVGFNSEIEQIRAIIQLVQSDSLQEIGILLPNNEMVLKLYKQLTQEEISVQCKYKRESDGFSTLDFTTKETKIMTYHSAKGLQFKTVILPSCCLDGIRDVEQQKALYVAMTRTYKNLYVMYIGDKRPYPLDKIDENLFLNKI